MPQSFIPVGRDVRIDLLRAVAVIQLVLMHALQLPSVSEDLLNRVVLYIPDPAGIFFVASGMLIFPVERPGRVSAWRYVWHRVWSILPEFVIFSALYVGLDTLYGANLTDLDGWERLCWMFVRPTWGPGWFIIALIGLYAVSPILSAWLERARRRDVEVMLGVWMAACFVPLMTPYVIVDVPRTAFGTLFNYGGYMVLGYYLQRWPLAERSGRFLALYFGMAVFGGVVCSTWLAPRALVWGYLPNLGNGLCINVVLVVALETGLVMLLRPTAISRSVERVTALLSVCSLGFYCSHWFFIRYLCEPLGWGYMETVAVTLIGSTVIAIAMRYMRSVIVRCSSRNC